MRRSPFAADSLAPAATDFYRLPSSRPPLRSLDRCFTRRQECHASTTLKPDAPSRALTGRDDNCVKRNNDTAGRSYSRGKLRNFQRAPKRGSHSSGDRRKKVRVKIVAAPDHLNFKDIEARHGFRSKGVPNEKYNSWAGARSGAAFRTSTQRAGRPGDGAREPR